MCEAQREDVGGVIGGWNGNVVRNFSGPVNSLDADEAEVFALPIGCRQLLRVGFLNPFLGDSFLAIQWGSGKAIHPWRLGDWVEEVQDILRQTRASSNHFLREK